MRTIKLTIAYDGTRYNGWQVQKNGNTVQAELERAIEKAAKRRSRVHAAGRTDAGVHAKGQVAHYTGSSDIPSGKIPVAVNTFLPRDIAILKAEEVSSGFHSQYDAKSKLYSYYIFNSRRRDPFRERYSWRVPYELDIPLMRREAGMLLGRQDFKCFQARDKRERTSVRDILSVGIKRKGTTVRIDIEADGFLYNMVRNITGTLVDSGRGYLPEGSVEEIIGSKDRTKAGPTAPPQGLFLMKVRY
ncbi:MAG: tRNA pseudouridine(38-40) synthase TruA [Candidatus Omnitrophica bacterium]|nr:tRNA pseudouridine(38-40) synthase TruA [Candidatus Omnitrophota bacterium]